MKLYIVRHGETDWNKEKRVQGHSDIPLNEFGISLAKKTAIGLKNVKFDVAYSSPLCRASETARLIIDDDNVPRIEDERLEEIGFGEYEGLCCSKEGWNIPDREFKKFFESPDEYKAPKGGESFAEVKNRAHLFLRELYQKKEYENSNVLIATHGATLCGMLNDMKNLGLSEFWQGGIHRNCAVTIAEVHQGKPTILEEGIVYYDDEVQPW
ncbi:MAG: histidine phosphatase family protein [Lachnospiraceae bacterium]